MKISKSVINELNPCNSRFTNYIVHYGAKSFTRAQFMGLRKITQSDKLWVAFRLMPKQNIQLAAADIAESVLHIYEKAYPNDNRPRLAIEAARRGDRNTAAANAAANAADAAANAADAAYAAAYAATANAATAYAAANAAYAAANAASAAYAAANAATANAADAVNAAAYAAHAAANAAHRVKLEKRIRTIVLKYWKTPRSKKSS